MGAVDLEARVEHLEQALLKLCAVTMNLMLVVDPVGPDGVPYLTTKEDKDAAMDKAAAYLRDAAEIVSGERAPR